MLTTEKVSEIFDAIASERYYTLALGESEQKFIYGKLEGMMYVKNIIEEKLAENNQEKS